MSDHQADTERRVAADLRHEAAALTRLADRLDPGGVVRVDTAVTPEQAEEIKAAFFAGEPLPYGAVLTPLGEVAERARLARAGIRPRDEETPQSVLADTFQTVVTASQGARLVASERERQITEEGHDPAHDTGHVAAELAWAAACYVTRAADIVIPQDHPGVPTMWPWSDKEWKPKPDRVRNLVIAAALIVAEIDRTLEETQ